MQRIFSVYGIFENSNIDPKFDISLPQIKHSAKTHALAVYRILSKNLDC